MTTETPKRRKIKILMPVGKGNVPLAAIKQAVAEVAAARRKREAGAEPRSEKRKRRSQP